MHALVRMCIKQHMKFEVPSFTNSTNMTEVLNLRKRVMWPWPCP